MSERRLPDKIFDILEDDDYMEFAGEILYSMIRALPYPFQVYIYEKLIEEKERRE